MDRWIISAPRWLMLAALVFAPWAYGATRPWAVAVLNIWIGLASVLWFLGHLLRQQLPPIPRLLSIVSLSLAGFAWFMVLNARFDYDTARSEFIPLTPMISWAPGSLHRSLSVENATVVTAMLAALCIFCDLAQSSIWRKRMLWTIALTGASIALLGLAQKFTGARAIFWESGNMGNTFFGTYRYHANAGAFLNLTWPIATAFALLAFLRESARWKKALWLVTLVVSLVGVTANTSRASGTLGLVLLVGWVGWIGWQRFRGRLEGINLTRLAVVGVALLGIVASLAVIAGMDTTIKRWRQLDNQLTADNSRLMVAQVCLKMIPEAGPFGFGPGTFQTAFPYFTHEHGRQLNGRWLHAHEDYLQTVVEWGYVGTALWVVLVVGAIVLSVVRAVRCRGDLSSSVRLTHFAILLGVGSVLLHALVDFPLQIASIQLYSAALLGTLWASSKWLCPPRRRESSQWPVVRPPTGDIALERWGQAPDVSRLP